MVYLPPWMWHLRNLPCSSSRRYPAIESHYPSHYLSLPSITQGSDQYPAHIHLSDSPGHSFPQSSRVSCLLESWSDLLASWEFWSLTWSDFSESMYATRGQMCTNHWSTTHEVLIHQKGTICPAHYRVSFLPLAQGCLLQPVSDPKWIHPS